MHHLSQRRYSCALSVVSSFRRSRVMRLATALAVSCQVLSATPVFAQDATQAAVKIGNRAVADAKRKLTKSGEVLRPVKWKVCFERSCRFWGRNQFLSLCRQWAFQVCRPFRPVQFRSRPGRATRWWLTVK